VQKEELEPRMFDALLRGPTPWIILAVIVLLFGATRLPALARSVGQSMKIFRNEVKSDDKPQDTAADSTAASTAAPTSEAKTPADGTAAK
jgi:sec-independent protein translocase protein TatA